MFEKLKEHINDNGEDTSIIIKDAVNEYQEIISLLMKSGADPALQVLVLYRFWHCFGNNNNTFRTRMVTLLLISI